MKQFVYIVSTDGLPPVKIGATGSLQGRLSALKQKHGRCLKLEHSRATGHAMLMERVLLSRLKARRLHGEWFDISVDEARDALDGLPERVDELIALSPVVGNDVERRAGGNHTVTATEARLMLAATGLTQKQLAAEMSELTDRAYSAVTVSAWFREGGRGPSDACVVFLRMRAGGSG